MSQTQTWNYTKRYFVDLLGRGWTVLWDGAVSQAEVRINSLFSPFELHVAMFLLQEQETFYGTSPGTPGWASAKHVADETVLRLLQTISEISSIWRLKRLVTSEFIGAIQINIYLSIWTTIILFPSMSELSWSKLIFLWALCPRWLPTTVSRFDYVTCAWFFTALIYSVISDRLASWFI